MQPAQFAKTNARSRDAVARRVREAICQLEESGGRISFYAVADTAQVARSTLYRRQDLRRLVEEARNGKTADAHQMVGGLEEELARITAQRDALARIVRQRTPVPRYALINLSAPA